MPKANRWSEQKADYLPRKRYEGGTIAFPLPIIDTEIKWIEVIACAESPC